MLSWRKTKEKTQRLKLTEDHEQHRRRRRHDARHNMGCQEPARRAECRGGTWRQKIVAEWGGANNEYKQTRCQQNLLSLVASASSGTVSLPLRTPSAVECRPPRNSQNIYSTVVILFSPKFIKISVLPLKNVVQGVRVNNINEKWNINGWLRPRCCPI